MVGAYLRVGAFSREHLFNDFPNTVGANSNGALSGGGAYSTTWSIEFKDGFKLRTHHNKPTNITLDTILCEWVDSCNRITTKKLTYNSEEKRSDPAREK